MFIICFAYHNERMRVDVANMAVACHVWDTLATRFDMLSDRPMHGMDSMPAMIAAVRYHADKFYTDMSNDWDILAECWTDGDIANAIGDARTVDDAIINVGCALLEERADRYGHR